MSRELGSKSGAGVLTTSYPHDASAGSIRSSGQPNPNISRVSTDRTPRRRSYGNAIPPGRRRRRRTRGGWITPQNFGGTISARVMRARKFRGTANAATRWSSLRRRRRSSSSSSSSANDGNDEYDDPPPLPIHHYESETAPFMDWSTSTLAGSNFTPDLLPAKLIFYVGPIIYLGGKQFHARFTSRQTNFLCRNSIRRFYSTYPLDPSEGGCSTFSTYSDENVRSDITRSCHYDKESDWVKMSERMPSFNFCS